MKEKGIEIQLPSSEDVVFGLSVVSVLALIHLPYKYIDGNPIPTLIFVGRTSMFHAILVVLCFSLSGAAAAMSLREVYPKIARSCSCFAGVSMVAAMAIFIWVIVLASF